MPKNIAWRKLVKNFKALGFEGPCSGGRHPFMKKGELKVRIPNKHEGDISAGLICEILRQADINKKDWDKL
ncbi:type II toxin-antitoxin system HicA family toxin [Candidatus Parcubacteria bacterium]|nr:type II toxin-antitoxin system HicA family toxin [Candidatus Parcubacteria bacterium]